MPITVPELADLAYCKRELVLALGIADPSAPDGSVIAAAAPYNDDQLANFLGYGDYQVNHLIVENLAHPFRTQFVTQESDWLANLQLIPPHLGTHTYVKTTTDAGATYAQGRLAQSLAHIQKVQDNPTVYGSPANLYFIHGGRVFLGNKTSADYKAKIDAVDIERPVDGGGVTNALKAPAIYSWAIIAHAVIHSAIKGFDEDHRRYWANFWTDAAEDITDGALSLPMPDRLMRVGT